MANPSTENVTTLALNLLREESGSDVPVISTAGMILSVAQADREALRALRRGGGNTIVERGLEGGNTLASETAVNNSSGVAASDVTITVDSTSGFEASGAAASWTKDMPDVFYYTSLSSTLISGVTGMAFAKADNDLVQPLYALPSNFGKFRRSEDYGDGVQLNGDPLSYIDGVPSAGKFSLRSDGTTTYLWLPRNSTGTASYLFDKDSNTIDSTDDLISLPDDWLFFYAWRTVEISLFGRGDFEIVSLAKSKADKELLDLLKDRNIGRRGRVRQYNSPDYDNYALALRENAL